MKNLESVKNIIIKLEKPLALDIEMQMKNLNLYTGANGTGKSFILKLNWMLNTFISYKLFAQSVRLPFNKHLTLQYLLDNTFATHNAEGFISFEWNSGVIVTATFAKGQVEDVTITDTADFEPIAQPIFMSTDTRLFTDIVKYMKFKKLLGLAKGTPNNDDELAKLTDMYRLYDIFYIEQLLHTIDNGLNEEILKQFNEKIEDFIKDFKLLDLQVDYNNSDIIYTTADKQSSLTTLSNGEQSMVNMMLATTLMN